MPDQHNYDKWISASYKMFSRGIEILILSIIYNFLFMFAEVNFVTFTSIIFRRMIGF